MNHMEVSIWYERRRGKETLLKVQLFKASEYILLLSLTDRRMLKETNKLQKLEYHFITFITFCSSELATGIYFRIYIFLHKTKIKLKKKTQKQPDSCHVNVRHTLKSSRIWRRSIGEKSNY